jgi:DNA-binding transcriptional MerR regulator
MQRLLSIGQYAQLVGLSVSALRFYADSGLLRPVQIDQDSGYRYYAPEQIPVGQKIAALRRLDLPLDELSRLLEADPAQGRLILERHEQRLLERFQAQRQQLQDVGALLSGQRYVPEVETTYRDWPAQWVLSLTGAAPTEVFGTFYQKALSELQRQAAVGGFTVTGYDFGLYHADDYLGGPLQVEVCLPVQAAVPVTEFPVTGQVRLLQLPACRVICALHRADWQTFNLTYAALYDAASRADLKTGASYTLSQPGGTELGFLLH